MGFTEILTFIFVVCKLFGVINWNWVLVLLPEIIAVAFYFMAFILNIVGFVKISKKINDSWDKF